MKIYVSNLSFNFGDEDLENLFTPFGNVVSASIVNDRETGRSRGFGFVEIGSVTPRPQAGNPRPRLFRLERDEAIINRMGFNNDGAEIVLRRLAARASRGAGIIGVNVGANKDSTDRTADYVKLIETFAPVASYFTVNVSSPNTPGLRNLQQSAALDDLLARVIETRERVRRNAGDSPVLPSR